MLHMGRLFSASSRRTLAGDDAAPVEEEMSTTAAGESMGEKKLGSTAKGEKKKSFDERGL